MNLTLGPETQKREDIHFIQQINFHWPPQKKILFCGDMTGLDFERKNKQTNKQNKTNKTKTKTKPKSTVTTYHLCHLNVNTKIALNKKTSSPTRLT